MIGKLSYFLFNEKKKSEILNDKKAKYCDRALSNAIDRVHSFNDAVYFFEPML